jgi:hypothetical protein
MMFDLEELESLLQAAAAARRPLGYGEVLRRLDRAFSRRAVRELCLVLGEVDRRAAARGEPGLAVLVVRQADGLPGDGFYDPELSQAERLEAVRAGQAAAFAFWAGPGLADEDPDPTLARSKGGGGR